MLGESFCTALAGIDGFDVVQLPEMDIAVDEQPGDSHAKVVVSQIVEDFAFVGANKSQDFVQAEDAYTALVDSLY